MPPARSDRALRRLVAELARAHPDDVAAVLAELEPTPRERVQALIGAYLGQAPPEQVVETLEPQAAEAADALGLGLSPWLARRVRGEEAPDGGRSADASRMTQTAQSALRAAAEELAPAHAASGPLPPLTASPARPRRRPWP
jgi:hypothetical protein